MADTRFALEKAVELTKQAIQTNDGKINAVANPDHVAAFLEAMHDKLIELTEKDGY